MQRYKAFEAENVTGVNPKKQIAMGFFFIHGVAMYPLHKTNPQNKGMLSSIWYSKLTLTNYEVIYNIVRLKKTVAVFATMSVHEIAPKLQPTPACELIDCYVT